jgi:hypothetical protein
MDPVDVEIRSLKRPLTVENEYTLELKNKVQIFDAPDAAQICEKEWESAQKTAELISLFAKILYEDVPCLESLTTRFSIATSEMFAQRDDPGIRMNVCYFIRVIFEVCINRMLCHARISNPENMSLTDRLKSLKPFLSPIQTNSFFEIKDIASEGLHANSHLITLRQLRRILNALQEVLEECTDFLRTLPRERQFERGTSDAKTKFHFDTRRVVVVKRQKLEPLPELSEPAFKTQLCRHYRLGSCQYEERCNFAHGTMELRK